jgi:hypothetical protein
VSEYYSLVIIFAGQIIERQRDRKTREVKCIVSGVTLAGAPAETVIKLGPTGKLVVITVYLAWRVVCRLRA